MNVLSSSQFVDQYLNVYFEKQVSNLFISRKRTELNDILKGSHVRDIAILQ